MTAFEGSSKGDLLKHGCSLLAILLALCVSSSARSVATLSSTPAFVLVDCLKDTLALRFISVVKPLAVRTETITARGADAPHSVPWNISWRAPIPTEPAINEYEAVGMVGDRCPVDGKYTVIVKIVTSATDGGGDRLEISVERQRDPSLYVAPQFSSILETLPFQTRAIRLPTPIQMREESHSNPIVGLTIMPAELRASTGDFIGIQIYAADPQPITIDSGTAKEISLALTATPAPGIYTARLPLHSPLLVSDLTVEMALKVRVVSAFLFLILAAGVALGWVVNVWLSANAALDAAMLDAMRAADGIVARARSQRDPAVQQRLVSLAGSLQAKIRSCRTVQELQSLVTTIQNNATAIEAQADATSRTFLQDLAAARSIFAPNNLVLDEMIENCLRVAIDSLDRIERLGGTGDIEEAERQLQSYQRALPQLVLTALRAWLYMVKSALDEFGAWGLATQEPEQSRAALLQNIGAAYAAMDPAVIIQQANAIAARLRGWMALTVPLAVVRIFQATSAALHAGGRSDLASAVAACADDVTALHSDDPLMTLNAISAIRRRAEDAMRAADPQNDNVNARLMAGDFLGAASLVAPLPPAAANRTTGAAEAYIAGVNQLLPRAAMPLPPTTVGPIPLRLRLPSDLTVGQAVEIAIDWSGVAPAGLAYTWQCQPPGAADIATAEAAPPVLTAKEPGFLTIVANIGGYPPISASSYVGSVQQTPDFEALQKREQRLKLTMWAATAVLTTGVGYQIFVGAWLGTTADFAAAFLWGFFGQFGLDRIRDLARPATGKVMT
jgi:hypothetical protein